MAMATSVCLPSPLATGATAVRASTSHPAHRRCLPRRLPRSRPFGRAAAGMDAFHVSSRDAEPLLHTAASAANATHRRLRVRTHAQGAEDVSTGAGDGAAAAAADYSLAAIILPFVFPALGGLLFGYDIGATSGATISVHSAALSGTTWFGLSSVQLGLVASGSLYGALGGSILAYRIADFLGRRIELITAAGLYISGALVTGLAPNFVVLIIGRLLYGIGIGLDCCVGIWLVDSPINPDRSILSICSCYDERKVGRIFVRQEQDTDWT